MGSDDEVFSNRSAHFKLSHFVFGLIEKPIVWFRENVVLPNRQEYYWYHEQLRRVPTIDECYSDDIVCMYEAEQQYRRDRKVDMNILHILKKRNEYCLLDNINDQEMCAKLKEDYENAMTNYFIKYGDLGWKQSALKCYMKQKNRMAWERRHGPVGSGRKPPEEQKIKKSSENTC